MRTHYKQLDVWNRGVEFAARIYGITAPFPRDERFGLVQDMRRAAISMPKNLSEGWGRTSAREYAHFVEYSIGSNCELDTQLTMCRRVGYIEPRIHDELDKEREEIRAMLLGLLRALR